MARTVVFVHEHPHVAASLSTAMARAGYTLRAAHTFRDAKTLLENSDPAAVILSVELGAFNGLHLLLHVGALHPSAITIVVGPASRAVAEDAKALGADSYVARPVTDQALVDLLQAFLSPRAAFPAPAPRSAASLR